MSLSNEDKEKEILEYWRHRDSLTWQLPAFLVLVTGVLLIGAYTLNISQEWESIIRIVVLGLAWFFSLSILIMLSQNLYYQYLHEDKLGNTIRKDWHIPVPKRKRIEGKVRKVLHWTLFGLGCLLFSPILAILLPIVLGVTSGLENGKRWKQRLGNIITFEKGGSSFLLFLCGIIFCITSGLYIHLAVVDFGLPYRWLFIAAWAMAFSFSWFVPFIDFIKQK